MACEGLAPSTGTYSSTGKKRGAATYSASGGASRSISPRSFWMKLTSPNHVPQKLLASSALTASITPSPAMRSRSSSPTETTYLPPPASISTAMSSGSTNAAMPGKRVFKICATARRTPASSGTDFKTRTSAENPCGTYFCATPRAYSMSSGE